MRLFRQPVADRLNVSFSHFRTRRQLLIDSHLLLQRRWQQSHCFLRVPHFAMIFLIENRTNSCRSILCQCDTLATCAKIQKDNLFIVELKEKKSRFSFPSKLWEDLKVQFFVNFLLAKGSDDDKIANLIFVFRMYSFPFPFKVRRHPRARKWQR